MRIYSALSMEALHARGLLKDWAAQGLLTEAQYQVLDQETVCDLRRTNIFLRLVLFLFTLIIVGAGSALFFAILLSRPSQHATGVLFLIFAAITYGAAEYAVSHGRLYRHGIEEALVVCSVGFFCSGLRLALWSSPPYSPIPNGVGVLIPIAGAVLSLWIWRRFGLPYAFPAAMIFVLFLPGHWTSSPTAQHVTTAVFYAIGLGCVAAVRSRHRFDYLDAGYSLVEAFLWFGIYLAMNLQLSSLNPFRQSWGVPQNNSDFSRPFYWATWVVIWCLPLAVLARGLRRKDRFVLAVGAIAAVLTLATNKPYLGWQRNTWDPMILGALLIGFALAVRRWLASAPGGIRDGFTAERLSEKDKHWMNTGSAVFGLFSPHGTNAAPQSSAPDVRFGGGDSGGGGATSDF